MRGACGNNHAKDISRECSADMNARNGSEGKVPCFGARVTQVVFTLFLEFVGQYECHLYTAR
jgi:hypothetical protein